MDDKAVECGWGLFGETAALPKNNPKSEAKDQECDIDHGRTSARVRLLPPPCAATMRTQRVPARQQLCSGPLPDNASPPSRDARCFPHPSWPRMDLGHAPSLGGVDQNSVSRICRRRPNIGRQSWVLDENWTFCASI